MPYEPTDDTQPFANPAAPSHRHYVPATWAEKGEGGGAPKLSGGYELDNRTGERAPRSFNRPSARYAQDAATLETNRATRGAEEAPDCYIAQGAGGETEIRTPSGNNYDIAADGFTCDCPDRQRLNQSGHPTLKCKHVYAVEAAVASAGGYANLPWAPSKWAETVGIAIRTAESLCRLGIITATKKLDCWQITPGDAETAAETYRANMWPYT